MDADIDRNFYFSTLREQIVEHVFIGDALRRLWQHGISDVEVLHSEFDTGGYDVVLSCLGVDRHIQFKTVGVNGKRQHVTVSLKLMNKPCGCVIWIVIDNDLKFDSFLWFGRPPGERLHDIQDMKTARHSKGTREGTKNERPNQRIVPRTRFEKLSSLDEVLTRLFGELPP